MGEGGGGKRRGGRYDSEAAGVADGAGEFGVTDPVREISQIYVLVKGCEFGPLHATLNDGYFKTQSAGEFDMLFRDSSPRIPSFLVKAVVKGIATTGNV